jgi:hypothetical protein
MKSVPVSCTILVEMEVSRFEPFPEDGMVQIWGHVGDYEASVWLPMSDKRAQSLLTKKSGGKVGKSETGLQ